MFVILTWVISLASIVLMLVRPRGIPEWVWIGGGAVVLVAARLLPLGGAMHAIREGVDVYLFLAGMMILAELAREEGVFDWVADIAVHHARGSASRLFLWVYLVGTVVTALLSNDATAVVLTPAVLAAVRRAKVEPRPHLLACALIANAASFLLPIWWSTARICRLWGPGCGCSCCRRWRRLWRRLFVCGCFRGGRLPGWLRRWRRRIGWTPRDGWRWRGLGWR
jgi:di/tricarboxylate transporter